MEAIKRLRSAGGWTLLFALKTAGVAQLVEHHLAKVDVASSSLVTRSSLRLKRCAKARGGGARAGALAKSERPSGSSYGWQASLVMLYVYLLKPQPHLKQSYV